MGKETHKAGLAKLLKAHNWPVRAVMAMVLCRDTWERKLSRTVFAKIRIPSLLISKIPIL